MEKLNSIIDSNDFKSLCFDGKKDFVLDYLRRYLVRLCIDENINLDGSESLTNLLKIYNINNHDEGVFTDIFNTTVKCMSVMQGSVILVKRYENVFLQDKKEEFFKRLGRFPLYTYDKDYNLCKIELNFKTSYFVNAISILDLFENKFIDIDKNVRRKIK